MDFKSIQEMIKAMDTSKLGYLEVNWDGVSIVMRKQGELALEKSLQLVEGKTEIKIESRNSAADRKEEAAFSEVILEEKNERLEEKEEKKGSAVDVDAKEITSPIVGTFYASSAPDKPALVSVGTKLKKGDTLCIIEAMKLMNEIQSEVDGEVVEVLVENGQMVQYGEVMFKIKAV